jgi:hypothetical protein
MIDNIELIKPILNFEEEGDFYMLYVMVRKKDQPEGEKDNHQSARTIKTYPINNIKYLEKRYGEIKMLCEVFKARAYIHVQKQNDKDVSLEMLSTLATRVKNRVYNQRELFDTVVNRLKVNERRWVVDIDTKEVGIENLISNEINLLRPVGNKVEAVLPTKSGYHLITKKFDLEEFTKLFPNTDVQKKSPTLLYLPNSLH